DQGNARVGGLDDGREKVGGGRPRGAHERDRLASGLRQAQAKEGGRALVEVQPEPSAGVARDGQRERRRARARTDAEVPNAGSDQGVDEAANKRGEGLARLPIGRHDPLAARADSTGRSFQHDPAYSRAGFEAATIPQPANSVASFPDRSAERIPTANSPSPRRSSQPTGPAYQPRSSRSRT